jgi:hypothetical protein
LQRKLSLNALENANMSQPILATLKTFEAHLPFRRAKWLQNENSCIGQDRIEQRRSEQSKELV